jgi:hypothetical protein
MLCTLFLCLITLIPLFCLHSTFICFHYITAVYIVVVTISGLLTLPGSGLPTLYTFSLFIDISQKKMWLVKDWFLITYVFNLFFLFLNFAFYQYWLYIATY